MLQIHLHLQSCDVTRAPQRHVLQTQASCYAAVGSHLRLHDVRTCSNCCRLVCAPAGLQLGIELCNHSSCTVFHSRIKLEPCYAAACLAIEPKPGPSVTSVSAGSTIQRHDYYTPPFQSPLGKQLCQQSSLMMYDRCPCCSSTAPSADIPAVLGQKLCRIKPAFSLLSLMEGVWSGMAR